MGGMDATLEGAAKTEARSLLNAFWMYSRRRGRTSATQVQYAVYLDPFTAWVGDRDLNEITARQVELEWLSQWYDDFGKRHDRLPAPKTVANHLTALTSFFTFLERFDHVDRNVMRRIDPPKVTQRPNDWLKPEEDEALLAACHSPQEQIIVPVLRFSGMRSGSELAVHLTKRDVDLKARAITVRHSKTPRGRRVIPIVAELVPYIERWLDYERILGHDDPRFPFLSTKHGTPILYKQIHGTVKRVATRAGVRLQPAPDNEGVNTSEVSPHTLRRTFGSSLLNQGVRLEVVSRLLGHESTLTTERAYAQLLDSTIAAELLAAFD
jgi:site-specific recombinase XerD